MVNKKAIRAARLYLDMRGFEVLEQNWGQSSNRIDLIAKKDNLIHFINLSFLSDDINLNDAVTKTKVTKAHAAALAWLNEEKYDGKFIFSNLELSLPELTIMNFNEGIY